MSEEKLSHRDLCIIASEWLKKSLRCTISIYEPKGIKENPDAIGWRYGYGGCAYEGSILVECKTSRSDFKTDFKKQFRIEPEKGIGNWRYYMCPEGVISVNEVPEKWGLLYVTPKKRVKIIKHPYKDNQAKSKYNVINTENERFLLTRWLARTENPEKWTLIVRETNTKYNRLITRYDKLQEQNSKLQMYKQMFTTFSLKDGIKDQDVDTVADELHKLRHLKSYVEEFLKDQDVEKFSKIAKRYI